MGASNKTWVDSSDPTCAADDLNGLNLEINNAIINSGQVIDYGDRTQLGKIINKSVVQDFTTIGSIGSLNQQFAGFDYSLSELQSVLGTVEAYFRFPSGSLGDDETGVNDLSPQNSPTNTTGIVGTNFATNLVSSSSQFYEATTNILGNAGDFVNGLTLGVWLKPSDGQPSSAQVICSFMGDDVDDSFTLSINTDGSVSFFTNAASDELQTSPVFDDGSNGFSKLAFCWDANGKRIYFNDYLVASDSTTYNLTNSTSITYFSVGRSLYGQYFDGDISNLFISDTSMTADINDYLYSVKYTNPVNAVDTDFQIYGFLAPGGNQSLKQQINWGNMEVARNSASFYRQGGLFDSTDELRIMSRA